VLDCAGANREQGGFATGELPSVKLPVRVRSKKLTAAVVCLVLCGAAAGVAKVHYHLPFAAAPGAVARVAGTPILGRFLQRDLADAAALRQRVLAGEAETLAASAAESWTRPAMVAAGVTLAAPIDLDRLQLDVPFVYESEHAPYLRDLVATAHLREAIAGAPTEYDAMLRLGGWLGRRFDHGADALGRRQEFIPPTDVLAMASAGKKFWCEVAARLTVHAATALGWQARLVTASLTGYSWDHAVAELWSNEYRKWFVLDADFNVVYEDAGVPLSAFELCRKGAVLNRLGMLHVRAIAPKKPSLRMVDLMPFYAYVHIDLRNDWNSRHLQPGSPAGGDRSTWWTARPELGPVLTAKTRVDGEAQFNWDVNSVTLHARDVERAADGSSALRVALAAYSPSFQRFQASVDGGPWRDVDGTSTLVPLTAGSHTLRARVMTTNGYPGPDYGVRFSVSSRL
jgi:hypothetical protein